MKTKLLTLLATLACAVNVMAWNGEGTNANPYQIKSTQDWATLCSNVNSGTSSYQNTYFKLLADINVEETFSDLPNLQLGRENKEFRGIFDGNGHTITVNFTDNSDKLICGLFREIRNATIKNLHVAGYLYKDQKQHAGGIVGRGKGTLYITNCRSSVDILANINGQGAHGGLIGVLYDSGDTDDTFVTNCLFDGKLRSTTLTSAWGGMIGYVVNEPDVYFTNCLVAPQGVSINYDYSCTFAGGIQNRIHVNNTDRSGNNYHTYEIGENQGSTDAFSYLNTELRNALGDGWEIITEGNKEKVVPVMDNRNLQGKGTQDSPYLIASVEDWLDLANDVNDACYQQAFFKLVNDITITSPVGESEEKYFGGTFDGNGHTITVNFKALAENPGMAPFRFIGGATIKNLHIDGRHELYSMHAGGLVGFCMDGSINNIINCRVSSNMDVYDYAGGIVGHAKSATLNLSGCLFDGKWTKYWGPAEGDDEESVGHPMGGLVGWTDDATLSFTDCLYDGDYHAWYASEVFHPIAIKHPAASVTCTLTNTFYRTRPTRETHECFVSYDAKYPCVVSAEEGITLAFSGEKTVYDVSGITASEDGQQYQDILLVPALETVAVDLSGADGYFASAGTLSGAQNPYSLVMPDGDVTISGCQNKRTELTDSACETYTWNGTTYDSSGDYEQTFPMLNGCDSIVTLHLTIHQPKTTELYETTEAPCFWRGKAYIASGDYEQHFLTTHGCDSTVILHLTITEPAQTYTNGLLPGVFSVAADKKVQFAQGNLQYQDLNTPVWRLANSQNAILNRANLADGAIDRFAWTADDWGENPILNGGNTADTWRTLTADEWYYLFYYRQKPDSLFGFGKVDGKNGIILLPDNWQLPEDLEFKDAASMGISPYTQYYVTEWGGNQYDKNPYSLAQWARMEAAGAVFLPAPGNTGHYWSSSPAEETKAFVCVFYCVNADQGMLTSLWPSDDYQRTNTYSVRLVQDKPNDDPTALDLTTNEQSPITNKILREGQLLIEKNGKTYDLLGTQVR